MAIFPKENHGLNEEDINVRDKQNFPAVQRLASPCVRQCLTLLGEGVVDDAGKHHKEDVRGTILHLEIIWAYLQVYFGRDTLEHRVFLVSFVTHIMYMGREYILHRRHGHTLMENWFTRQSEQDLLLSCHHAVLLIMTMRDFFPNLPVSLDTTGSDCCEDIFSLLGQEVLNKRNFSFGEALERMSQICRTGQIKVDKDSPQFAPSRRRRNFWWGRNQPTASANMQAYEGLENSVLERVWQEGLQHARVKAAEVGMVVVLQQADKWNCPWPLSIDDIHRGQIKSSKRSLPPSIECDEDDSNMSSIVRLAVLDVVQEFTELQETTDAALSVHKDKPKVQSTIEVEGKGLVHKMRVITELNLTPEKLPIDRLRRVQARQIQMRTESGLRGVQEEEVGLFDDIGVFVVQGVQTQWYIGRIQRIFKKLDNGRRVEYHRPVPLGHHSDKTIHVMLKYYRWKSDAFFEYGGYEEEGEADVFSLSACIAPVTLIYDASAKLYELANEDKLALDNYVSNERVSRRPVRRDTSTNRRKKRVEGVVEPRNGESSEGIAVKGTEYFRVGTTTRNRRNVTKILHI